MLWFTFQLCWIFNVDILFSNHEKFKHLFKAVFGLKLYYTWAVLSPSTTAPNRVPAEQGKRGK